ncbi:MAG TPA: sugar transferase, partial [Candidatus Didemnitutus sp.]
MTTTPSSPVPEPGAAAQALDRLHRRNVRAYLDWSVPARRPVECGGMPLPMPVVALRNPLPPWKRTIDVAASLAALPALALGALAVTLLMRCVCPGPVFYRQERIGFAGRRIRIFRFRTQPIRGNAPASGAIGSARPLPGGWILRASGIEELPQVLNVLRGEMSIVGPRPLIPAPPAAEIPGIDSGRLVLPGITGLAQVSARRPRTNLQSARFDSLYARRFSLRSDLRILALTVPTMFRQVGGAWRQR